MRKILKEPLLHFLGIGALLFVLFGFADSGSPGDTEIVVSAGRIGQLVNIFGKTWQRPPTEERREPQPARRSDGARLAQPGRPGR